jgi:putative phosphoesterase
LRLAIIADTHMPKGRRALPARCLEELRRADLVVHLGDVTGAKVLDELRALGPPVEAIKGNVDDLALQRALPAERVLRLEGVTIALVHDAGPRTGRLSRLKRRFPGADAVLFGHSHLPLLEREHAFQIFNPGSPTERRRAPARTMGIGIVSDGSLALEHVTLS